MKDERSTSEEEEESANLTRLIRQEDEFSAKSCAMNNHVYQLTKQRLELTDRMISESRDCDKLIDDLERSHRETVLDYSKKLFEENIRDSAQELLFSQRSDLLAVKSERAKTELMQVYSEVAKFDRERNQMLELRRLSMDLSTQTSSFVAKICTISKLADNSMSAAQRTVLMRAAQKLLSTSISIRASLGRWSDEVSFSDNRTAQEQTVKDAADSIDELIDMVSSIVEETDLNILSGEGEMIEKLSKLARDASRRIQSIPISVAKHPKFDDIVKNYIDAISNGG